MNIKLKRILLFLITAVILLGVLRFIRPPDFKEHLIVFGAKNLFILCVLQIITMLLINAQSYTIAKQIGQKVGIGKLIHINTISTLVESVTPSVKAGGEAVKVILLKKHGGLTTGNAIAIVSIQKLLSLFSFITLSCLSILFTVKKLPSNEYIGHILISFFILASIVFLTLIIIVFSHKTEALLKWLRIKDTTKDKIIRATKDFSSTTSMFTKNKRILIFQLSLSFAIWILYAIKSIIIANILNIGLDYITISSFTYLAYMAGMVPLLPGGLGAFEGSMILFLTTRNISMGEGIAFTVILRFVTFWFVTILSALYTGAYNLAILLKYNHNKKWKHRTT